MTGETVLSERVKTVAQQLSLAAGALRMGTTPSIDVARAEAELAAVLSEHLAEHRARILRELAARCARTSGSLRTLENGCTSDAVAIADQLTALLGALGAVKYMVDQGDRDREAA